jgi:hypothetical protein
MAVDIRQHEASSSIVNRRHFPFFIVFIVRAPTQWTPTTPINRRKFDAMCRLKCADAVDSIPPAFGTMRQ